MCHLGSFPSFNLPMDLQVFVVGFLVRAWLPANTLFPFSNFLSNFLWRFGLLPFPSFASVCVLNCCCHTCSITGTRTFWDFWRCYLSSLLHLIFFLLLFLSPHPSGWHLLAFLFLNIIFLLLLVFLLLVSLPPPLWFFFFLIIILIILTFLLIIVIILRLALPSALLSRLSTFYLFLWANVRCLLDDLWNLDLRREFFFPNASLLLYATQNSCTQTPNHIKQLIL